MEERVVTRAIVSARVSILSLLICTFILIGLALNVPGPITVAASLLLIPFSSLLSSICIAMLRSFVCLCAVHSERLELLAFRRHCTKQSISI